MSVSEDLIDFNIIEGQKENIQSLPGGRSARTLANLFSPSPLHKLSTPTPSDTKNLNDAIRQEYEAELSNISESDDPLDIYDRYVKWTLDAYPSAQATAQSQLLPLLERATKSFLKFPQYKNDPRYLKLWLSYIRFFSDSPRETFAFLARHNIGDGLALFYEEFASWLEGAGRWNQADEVYKMGVEKEARPTPRLLRKYNEFQARHVQQPQDSNEPSSPALPTVRPALAAKIDPFSLSTSPSDPQAPRPSSGVGGSATTKAGRQKLTIFSDDGSAGAGPGASGEPIKGWDSIGSLAERKKENAIEPKPWVGETLKAGGKKSSGPKMAVFKDQSLPQSTDHQKIIPLKEQVIVNPKNGRNERIFVNLEAVYPTPEQPGTEFSFEELRAKSRGWLSKMWEHEKAEISVLEGTKSADAILEPPAEESANAAMLSQNFQEKLIIPRDPVMLDENGAVKEAGREGRGRKLKTVEVNETQIIKTKLSSPSGKKLKRKAATEPTMTFHTRAATDEIYDLFNQPLKSSIEEEDDDESDQDDGDETDGDYTSGGESTGTGRLVTTSEAGDDETSEVKSVSEWSDFTTRKHIPNLDYEDDDDTRGSHLTKDDTEEEIIPATEINTQLEPTETEEVVTPVSPEAPRTMFIPIPPEDYVAPTRPYRNASQASQNRLPFMTPIAEKTESSLGASTSRVGKDYFNSSTPSKENGSRASALQPRSDELMSSPFQEILNESLPRQKIPQPALSRGIKTTKPPTVQAKAKVSGVQQSKDLVQKGPLIKDAQCNPVDEYTRDMIFEGLQPPLSSYEGFFEHTEESAGRSAELKKFAKAVSKMNKNGNDKTATNIAMPPVLSFPSIDRQYMVKKELGAGAFAPVYLIENVAQDEMEDEDNQPVVMGKGKFDHFGRKGLEALKMEDPPTAWEFYIMRQAKRRLGVSRAAESILDVYEMHLYADECYLIEEYRDQGTLLDLVNIARADSTAATGVMDESLVMFFSIELFRIIEALHSKGILHGDLKADNCLVRFDAVPDDQVWTPRHRRDGTGGWNQKGLCLIDFGRGIDMKAFRPDVQFIADWKTSAQDCAEMRELRPWTYQIDYHGLAGIIHSMLFGKYIDTVADRGGPLGAGSTKTYRIRESLKRYWQVEIWAAVFDLLLNPLMHLEGEEGVRMPVLKGMRRARVLMEDWLEANCEKGTGLQAGIRRLESMIQGKRR